MQVGTIVGERFSIERLAGEGGMGAVYLARDLGSGKPAALKVLRAAGEDEEARFAREASVLSRLSHPAIVACLGHGLLPNGQPFLAMEWVDGEDLATRLARGPLAPEDALLLARAVGSALGAAHALGIVHRDVKPGNVILDGGDPTRPKLIDFGLARIAGAHQATLTGALLGTPAYMAPEQVRGASDVDARADLYALGATLFECLTGRRPFVSQGHVLGVITQVLFEPAPRLREVVPAMPEALDALVASLLEKDPELRPKTAADVTAALATIEPGAAAARPSSKAPGRSLTEDELRLVSVVLVSAAPVSGSNALDDTLLDRHDGKLLPAVERVAAPFLGRVEGLGDGTVLVVLAGRGAATDQAAAAARTALAIRGLATGRSISLATGRGHLGAGSLLSEAAARAASLARVRPAGDTEVAIDETTRGLLDARFSVERRGESFVLLAEDPFGEPARRLCGMPAPFVGREREVAFVERIFEEVVNEPRASAVVITGEAGAGKSRLGREVLAALQRIEPDVEIWVGRGEAVNAGAPFGMIAGALQGAASLLEGEPVEVRRQKLSRFLAERVSSSSLPAMATFLGELVGAPLPDHPLAADLRAARRDPMLMGDRIRFAFEDLVAAVTADHPLVFLLEDLHWGDVPTVKLLDLALRNLHARPFCVIALARPEVAEVFPGLFAERDVHPMRLGALSRRASQKLVRRILGEGATDEEVASIVDRGAGHPLFLEELVRSASEISSSGRTTLPETVLAMVQSRVEKLPAEARRVLRAGAVFGEAFWRGGVAALLGRAASAEETDAWLHFLCDREILEARREARFPGEREYAFRHAIFREAAYAMLTPADRTVGHALAGAFLEASGETSAALLATHFDLGDEPRRAAGHHLRASRDALEGGDFDAAVRRVDRVIEQGAEGPMLGECLAVKAEAAQWRGAYEEAERLAESAMALLEPGAARWFEAASALAIAAGRRISSDKLEYLCKVLRELGPAFVSSDAYIEAAVRVGLQAYIGGQYQIAKDLLGPLMPLLDDARSREPRTQGYLRLLEASRASVARQYDVTAESFLEAASLFERAGDLRGACSQRLDVCFFLLDLGQPERAFEIGTELVAMAERLGLSRIRSASRMTVGASLLMMDRLDEALETLLLAERDLDAMGDKRLGGNTKTKLGRCFRQRGDFDRAKEKLEEADRLLAGIPRSQAITRSYLALVCVDRGEVDEALAWSASAMETLAALGRMGTDEILVRLARIESLRAARRDEEARGEIVTAEAKLSLLIERLVTAHAKETFSSRVYENRRILEMAGKC